MQAETLHRPAAMSVAEFARELSVSRGTVYNLARAGKVTILKIGGRSIIRSSELDRFLAEAPELDQ